MSVMIPGVVAAPVFSDSPPGRVNLIPAGSWSSSDPWVTQDGNDILIAIPSGQDWAEITITGNLTALGWRSDQDIELLCVTDTSSGDLAAVELMKNGSQIVMANIGAAMAGTPFSGAGNTGVLDDFDVISIVTSLSIGGRTIRLVGIFEVL